MITLPSVYGASAMRFLLALLLIAAAPLALPGVAGLAMAADHGGSKPATPPSSYKGTIKDIDVTKKIITVAVEKTKKTEGGDMAFTIADTVRITMGSDAKTFADLAKEQKVTLRMQAGKVAAVEIEKPKKEKDKK